MTDKIIDFLKELYPNDSDYLLNEIDELIESTKSLVDIKKKNSFYSEKDVILITYADHVKNLNDSDTKSLKELYKFLEKYVDGIINLVHFLPFYPYSSDDGFSVIDYYQINSDFGDWSDVEKISKKFMLMFDMVINHCSAQSIWFKEFLNNEPNYSDYFISYDECVDTSKVFRPRTHPLLTKFETKNSPKYVWTTFSDDQVDLNFKSSKLFLESVKILLYYVSKGARAIRLDAIAYIWKELGTNCLHLPEVHKIVKLYRLILESVSSNIWIITETNVPHEENISYYGDGDEAHLVYNFSLPPLLLHTFLNSNSSVLTDWAKNLDLDYDNTAFFNFTASHDGVGLTPLKGIVSDEDINNIATAVEKSGGKVNYRTVSETVKAPYELNIVYQEAFSCIDAFLCSQAIALSLQGVPGIYFNSLIGAKNDLDGLKKLGYNRAINREKFDFNELSKELDNLGSDKNYVYTKYSNLIKLRTNEPLFSPHVEQEVLDLFSEVFCFVRSNGSEKLFVVANVTDKNLKLDMDSVSEIFEKDLMKDLISNKEFNLSKLVLEPYQILWLK